MWREHRNSGTSRRSFLAIGALAGLGLGDLLKLEALAKGDKPAVAGAGRVAKAKSIINIFMPGGMARIQASSNERPCTGSAETRPASRKPAARMAIESFTKDFIMRLTPSPLCVRFQG